MQYGKADATDEMIWKALEIAQAKEFVSELEDGLDSHVEQGGGTSLVVKDNDWLLHGL